MTIVITGGSGYLGSALAKTLLAKEHTVILVDTVGPSLTHQNLFFISCNLESSTLPFDVLERTDAVIHLAGVPRHVKQDVATITKHVIESLRATKAKPLIFISASSVSYYGEGLDRDLDERSAQGKESLCELYATVEKEALEAETLGARVVIVRSGMVVSSLGALQKLIRVARFHILPRALERERTMPWIHLDDLVKIYVFALETTTLQGVVNAVAPALSSQGELMKTLAKETKSLTVRLPFLQLAAKGVAQENQFTQKVHPQRLIDKGFVFTYPNIEEAVRDALRESK